MYDQKSYEDKFKNGEIPYQKEAMEQFDLTIEDVTSKSFYAQHVGCMKIGYKYPQIIELGTLELGALLNHYSKCQALIQKPQQIKNFTLQECRGIAHGLTLNQVKSIEEFGAGHAMAVYNGCTYEEINGLTNEEAMQLSDDKEVGKRSITPT